MLKRLNKKTITIILGALLLYLASTWVSYAAFSYLSAPGGAGFPLVTPTPSTGKQGFRVDLGAPKTETCPLNGGMFTKDERKIWEQHRPLTVMIENHSDSRPQSGLSRADIIYEAIAEGGITRLLAVFYCGAAAQDITIGPVRSARTYFMDFASEYGDYPLYAHVGGANVPGPANALGQIGDYGWLKQGNDLNQFSLGFPTFWRDYERIGHPVATEHTMYSTTDKLWEVAHKRGLDAQNDKGVKWDEKFEPWKFKDEAELGKRGETAQVEFDFWGGYSQYSVNWQYDKQSNIYKRINGGAPLKDLNNDEQIQAKTVILSFLQEKGPIDDSKHMLYTTSGKGKAIVFQDGQAIQASWKKDKRITRTKFFDASGKGISLNRGPIWIEILPAGREVKY